MHSHTILHVHITHTCTCTTQIPPMYSYPPHTTPITFIPSICMQSHTNYIHHTYTYHTHIPYIHTHTTFIHTHTTYITVHISHTYTSHMCIIIHHTCQTHTVMYCMSIHHTDHTHIANTAHITQTHFTHMYAHTHACVLTSNPDLKLLRDHCSVFFKRSFKI